MTTGFYTVKSLLTFHVGLCSTEIVKKSC